MSRIIRFTLAGMLGALVAWLVMEPTPLMPDDARAVSALVTVLVGFILGGLTGLFIGLAGSISGLSHRDGVKTIVFGFLIGAGGGIVGLTLGNIIWTPFHALEQQALGPLSPLIFLAVVFGRSLGWALLGAFVGVSQGIAVSSSRKMINGLVGGVVGGGAGGMVFQLLVSAGIFQPWIVRFISFAIMGGAIGLFIGVVEQITKKAWLVKDLGKGEGREYDLFRAVMVLGRDEYADIPVYGDPMVAKSHASISVGNGLYTIKDLGSSTGTSVNGTKVDSQVLKDGDTINLGTNKFIFRTKGSRRGYAASAGSYKPSADNSPVCTFCGQRKDAAGNCACTLVGEPIQVSAPAVQPDKAPLAGAKLICISGPYSGSSFALEAQQTLGRDPAAQIALTKDSLISRAHARIIDQSGKWIIEDLGSTNGTLVNETKVTRRELVPGDIIKLGNSTLRIEL